MSGEDRCEMPGCGNKATTLQHRDRFSHPRVSVWFDHCDAHSEEDVLVEIRRVLDIKQARKRARSPWPSVSPDGETQQEYESMRAQGVTHALAEMLALASPPACMTDAVFLEGHVNGRQFEKNPALGDFYKREAEARGVDVTGKVYLSGLAAYPGDPQAWVSGRGDVQRVCQERNWSCEGAVSVKGEREETGGAYQVAQDLVDERARTLQEVNPGLPREAAQESAREQLSPEWIA